MTRARLVGAGVALMAVLVLVTLLASRNITRDDPLDPDNPADAGAQAVARVLADEGVRVRVVRDQESLLATDLRDSLVAVTDPSGLGRTTARTLRDAVAEAGSDLLLVGTSDRVPGLAPADTGVVRGRVGAGCDLPTYAGLEIGLSTTLPLPPPGEDAGTACFDSVAGPLLVEDGTTTRFAASSVLRNDQVLRADNAALALRLLGARERLVWYVPSPADTRPTDGVSLTTLLPPWTGGVLLLGVVAGLAFFVQRGRRLGPLVSEPVPVPVRSAESTVARGRLYAAARDRDHAAGALRAGTRARLAARAGLDARADLDTLVGRLADQGQDEARARRLLGADPVRDDRQLVELAAALTRLEDEVART